MLHNPRYKYYIEFNFIKSFLPNILHYGFIFCWTLLWIGTPIINNNFGFNYPTELIKASWVIYQTRILLFLLLIYLFTSKFKISVNFTIIIALIIWLIFVIISWLYGVDPARSWIGNYYRYDGIMTLVHLLIIPFFFIFNKPKLIQVTTILIGIGCLLVSLISINQVIHFLINNFNIHKLSTLSFSSTHGQPNFTAGYLIISLPFLIYALRYFHISNRIKPLITLLPVLAIIFTQSRGGLLGLIVLAISYIILNKSTKSIIFISLIMTLGLIFFISKIYFNPATQYQAESRARIFTTLGLSIYTRPQGWGWANIDHAFEYKDWPVVRNDDVYLDKAHSEWLELAVATGILGLISFLFLQILAIKNIFASRSDNLFQATLISLTTYIIHSQTNVISISEQAIFWALVGFALAKSSTISSHKNP